MHSAHIICRYFLIPSDRTWTKFKFKVESFLSAILRHTYTMYMLRFLSHSPLIELLYFLYWYLQYIHVHRLCHSRRRTGRKLDLFREIPPKKGALLFKNVNTCVLKHYDHTIPQEITLGFSRGISYTSLLQYQQLPPCVRSSFLAQWLVRSQEGGWCGQSVHSFPETNSEFAPENRPPGKGDSYWKPSFSKFLLLVLRNVFAC